MLLRCGYKNTKNFWIYKAVTTNFLGSLQLPVLVFVSYDAILHGLFHLIHDGVRIGVCHHQRLRARTFLRVFLHKGIVLHDLPLLVVQAAVRLVVLQALSPSP